MIEEFAQTTLLDHAHRGTFTVDLPECGDETEVAAAFERLGCTVEPSPFDLALRVTAPRIAA